MWNDWVFVQDESLLPKQPLFYIGCMTGTSADSQADFTVATFDSTGKPIVYRNHAVPLPSSLQKSLCSLSQNSTTQITAKRRSIIEANLTHFLGQAYQHVIEQCGLLKVPSNRIILSPHGQTIDHQPRAISPYCDIIINGEMLAQQTGYRVVTRHRQALLSVSMAAPLAPLLIRLLFSEPDKNRFFINGGGIANICILPQKIDCTPTQSQSIIAYDVGPANAPLDSVIQHIIQSIPEAIPTYLASDILKQRCDVSGQWAEQGQVLTPVFKQLMNHPYFTLPFHQKSADRADFNWDWISSVCKEHTYDWADILATVTEVIVHVLAISLITHSTHFQNKNFQANNELILYGGIVHNTYLIQRLHSLLLARNRPFNWLNMSQLGYDPDFFEALLMAYLGYCTDNKRAVNVNYCRRKEVKNAFAIPGSVALPACHTVSS